jgi:hypothetical protein
VQNNPSEFTLYEKPEHFNHVNLLRIRLHAAGDQEEKYSSPDPGTIKVTVD